MKIYLAKPGGPKEGPFSVEQINSNLAARKYKEDEYWAWHEGLTAWVPLYSIGGVSGAQDTTYFFAKPVPKGSPAPTQPPATPASDTTVFLARPAFMKPQTLADLERATSAPPPIAGSIREQPPTPAQPEKTSSTASILAGFVREEPTTPVKAEPPAPVKTEPPKSSLLFTASSPGEKPQAPAQPEKPGSNPPVTASAPKQPPTPAQVEKAGSAPSSLAGLVRDVPPAPVKPEPKKTDLSSPVRSILQPQTVAQPKNGATPVAPGNSQPASAKPETSVNITPPFQLRPSAPQNPPAPASPQAEKSAGSALTARSPGKKQTAATKKLSSGKRPSKKPQLRPSRAKSARPVPGLKARAASKRSKNGAKNGNGAIHAAPSNGKHASAKPKASVNTTAPFQPPSAPQNPSAPAKTAHSPGKTQTAAAKKLSSGKLRPSRAKLAKPRPSLKARSSSRH